MFGEVYETNFVGHQFQIPRCAIFFLVGVHLKDHIIKGVALYPKALAVSACVLPLMLVLREAIPVPQILLDSAAIAAAVYLGVRISNGAGSFNTLLKKCGRNTLPIYLLHFPVVSYASFALADLVKGSERDILWLMVSYPPAIAFVSVVFSLIAHRFLTNIGATWLFDLPTINPQLWFRKAASDRR